jgi:hypothetical protein
LALLARNSSDDKLNSKLRGLATVAAKAAATFLRVAVKEEQVFRLGGA